MITSTATSKQIMSPNLSFFDRQVRFVIGVTILGGALLATPESVGMWSIALLASIPFIGMAINGWDPLYAMAGKSAYVEGEEDIQQLSWTCPNIGVIDRTARLVLGVIAIAAVLTMGVTQGQLIFALLAVPLVVSAITAWDPVYAMLGINSFASRTDVETAELDIDEEIIEEYYVIPEPNQPRRVFKQAA